MLAVLHHNYNIDAENNGERSITRVNERVSRANGEPNMRLHKTLIFSWQKELMQFIRRNSTKHVIEDDELDGIDTELSDTSPDEINGMNEVNEEDLDPLWVNFFEHAIL